MSARTPEDGNPERAPHRALSPETLAAQALGRVDPRTGALVPPLHASTTFERDPDGGYSTGRGYIRPHNPTFDEPAELLATLEGGAGCLLFSSGMAAATAVFQSLLPGDHVVVARVMYWALRKWLIDFAMPWGLEVEFVDASDPDAIAAAVRPGRTRLVWIETPANPTWELTDIAAVAAIARDARARLAVDSTVATPVLTRPIALGADLVVHSLTKYVCGHGDAMGGAVAGGAALVERLVTGPRVHQGGTLSPFNAWLIARGAATLPLRMRAHEEGALALAGFLEAHPRVARVIYPGLESHPQHALARRQMENFSGMLAVQVAGGAGIARRMMDELEVFHYAVSLGHHRSLVYWLDTEDLMRSSFRLTGAQRESYARFAGEGVFRISVGLEDPDDLCADLDRVLR